MLRLCARPIVKSAMQIVRSSGVDLKTRCFQPRFHLSQLVEVLAEGCQSYFLEACQKRDDPLDHCVELSFIGDVLSRVEGQPIDLRTDVTTSRPPRPLNHPNLPRDVDIRGR